MKLYKNIVDLHTHTDNSPDGNHAPMYMSETACNKNIRAIAFTDHCEVDVFYQENYDRGIRQAFFEAAKAKSAYRGNLVVLNGLELGEPGFDFDLSEKIIQSQKYDIILGSIHYLKDFPDFYYIKDYEAVDRQKLLHMYFAEILTMLQWGKIDVLAHIFYPFRYIFEYNQIEESLDEYKKDLDEIFALAAEKEIALEINTSGLRTPQNKLNPDVSVLRWYKDLGGKLITVGSDAHFAQHIGVGIKQAYDAAITAGFQTITIFQQRHPIEIPIE